MALESKWFQHFVDSHHDPLLINILKDKDLGYEGIGMWWTLLEVFYNNDGYIKENELDSELWDLRMEDKDKVLKLFEVAGIKKNAKGYYKESVLKRIDAREQYCNMQKEKAQKRWKNEKKEKKIEQPATDNETGEIFTDKKVQSSMTQREFEISKEKKLKELDSLKKSIKFNNK